MSDAALKDLYERRRRAFARRPAYACTTAEARAVLVGDVACDVEQSGRALRVELGVEDGGSGSVPDPGELCRAGLAAGLALGYRAWAARLGVALESCAVAVVSEQDARGELGLTEDVGAAWRRVIFDVRVSGGAADEELLRVIDVANRRASVLANLAPGIERIWRIAIVRPE